MMRGAVLLAIESGEGRSEELTVDDVSEKRVEAEEDGGRTTSSVIRFDSPSDEIG